MDDKSLEQIINRIPWLKHKFIGTFPADMVPIPPRNKFCIINTDLSKDPGEHWILLANCGGKQFYCDSLGKTFFHYRNLQYLVYNGIKKLDYNALQEHQQLCGFYCIYFAHLLYKFNRKYMNSIRDVHVLRFISNFL